MGETLKNNLDNEPANNLDNDIVRQNNHSANQFLLRNYPGMPTEQVVKNSGERAGVLESKKVKRVGAYIDRLSERVLDPEKKHESGWRERFNEKYFYVLSKALVIKPENIPQSVYDQEIRLATERGYGLNFQIPANFEQQKQAEIIGDQESSLRSWYEYLTNVESGDNAYPAWFRYYAFRGMTELGRYDKESKKFFKRDETTIAPFPEINREALAMMYDVLSRALDQNGKVDFTEVVNSQNYSPQFKEAAKSNNFGRFYATAINELDRNQETVKSFEGEWRKYPQSNNPADAKILFNDIHGKGTGWCTAGGINTAESHLSGGDFYVYYCYNQNGQPTTPKIAIRTENGRVAEVRGTDANQNLGEEELAKIAQEKYHDMPGGDEYDKKTKDMARLTEIHRKFYSFKDGEYIRKNSPEELSAEDIRFLYQIDEKIEGFGYEEDPRIKQILNGRDARSDLVKCFNCAPEQISLTKEEALSGNIIYHYGNLDLGNLTSAEGLDLSGASIGGSLYFHSLTSAEGLDLSGASIGGDLDFHSLTSAEGLDLSGASIGGDLYLRSLIPAEGLDLSGASIGGDLYFHSLASAERDMLRQKYPNLSIRP